MKRVLVDHYGGPEVLRVVEDDDPRPGPGEVCVRVLAAGVVVAERLPLSDARHAHELLERSAARGKLVLVP